MQGRVPAVCPRRLARTVARQVEILQGRADKRDKKGRGGILVEHACKAYRPPRRTPLQQGLCPLGGRSRNKSAPRLAVVPPSGYPRHVDYAGGLDRRAGPLPPSRACHRRASPQAAPSPQSLLVGVGTTRAAGTPCTLAPSMGPRVITPAAKDHRR